MDAAPEAATSRRNTELGGLSWFPGGEAIGGVDVAYQVADVDLEIVVEGRREIFPPPTPDWARDKDDALEPLPIDGWGGFPDLGTPGGGGESGGPAPDPVDDDGDDDDAPPTRPIGACMPRLPPEVTDGIRDWIDSILSPEGGGTDGFPPPPERPRDQPPGFVPLRPPDRAKELRGLVWDHCKTTKFACNETVELWLSSFPSMAGRCEEILSRIALADRCLATRKLQSDECFGGTLDERHFINWDNTVKAREKCIAAFQDPTIGCA
jgi:hypothetical protein